MHRSNAAIRSYSRRVTAFDGHTQAKAMKPTDTDSAAGPPSPALVQAAFEGEGSFFDDPDLVQRLNLIRHLVQSTRLAVVVSGPAGVGKSTCLDQLQRDVDERWVLCRVGGSTTNEPARVLARLARCSDLPPDCGIPALRQLLAEHATTLSRNSRLPVIAVDDAHLLQAEALAELAALSAGEEGWHLLLYIEPDQRHVLAAAGLDSPTRAHNLDWPHLSEPQTGAYVLHRLASAGWQGDQPLGIEQVRKLHRDSAGLPGAINRLAPSLLVHKAAATPPAPKQQPNQRPAGPRSWRKILRGLALALIVAGVALVLTQQDRINALFEAPPAPEAEEPPRAAHVDGAPALATPPSALTTEELPLPAPVPAPAETPLLPAATAPETDTSGEGDPIPAAAPDSADGSPAAAEENALQQSAEQEPAASPTGPETEPSPRPEAAAGGEPSTEASEPDAAFRSTPEESDAGDNLAPQVASQTGPEAGTSVTEDSPAGAEPDASPAAANDGRPAPPEAPQATEAPEMPSPPSEPAPPAAASPTHPGTSLGPGAPWVLAQTPGHYTLQLLGSRELKPLLGMIERYDLRTNTAWYKVQYQGADWYVLVHGNYPDRRTANKAVAALPSGLRSAGPWPRPFSAVQQEVRSGRK